MNTTAVLKVVLSLAVLFSFSSSLIGCTAEKTQFEIDREEREEVLRRQEEQKRRQENEINDIRRQEFWNKEMKRYE